MKLYMMLGAKDKNRTEQPKRYKRVVHTRIGSCLIFHRWVDIGCISDVHYRQCKDCNARKAEGIGYISNESLNWVMDRA